MAMYLGLYRMFSKGLLLQYWMLLHYFNKNVHLIYIYNNLPPSMNCLAIIRAVEPVAQALFTLQKKNYLRHDKEKLFKTMLTVVLMFCLIQLLVFDLHCTLEYQSFLTGTQHVGQTWCHLKEITTH